MNLLTELTKVVMSGGAYYEATFVEGRINGAYKRYNGEGKLTAEEHYKNGKNDGTWKYYNDKRKTHIPQKLQGWKALGQMATLG